MDAKSPRDSFTEMTELVLPQHGNVLGGAFGGTVLSWMDICGAVAAQRHCHRVAVTAAIDEVSFVAPIRVGDVVVLSARLNAAFRSSMEVEVAVQVEDAITHRRTRCVDAFMTFVAIGEDRRPVQVPELVAETVEDRARRAAAEARRAERLDKRSR